MIEWLEDSGPADDVERALAGTGTLVWRVDLETGALESVHGPVESVLRIDGDAIETISEFLETGLHPEDLQEVEAVYREILDGEIDRFDMMFRSHPDNGRINWLEMKARIEAGTDGRRLSGITTDVTEWNGRVQRQEKRNERLEQLAGVVSHDLRNPLSVAKGHIELARDEHDGQHLQTAVESLEEMQSLVEDLLAAIDSGSPIIRGCSTPDTRATVEVSAVANACWDNVETPGARLRVETDATAQTDRDRLQQLLENLFRNAVEHGATNPHAASTRVDDVEQGSRPDSKARQDALEHGGRDVTVTIGDLEHRDGVYVADDGPGIPEADRDRIFESGYSTSESGFGLGLHIVQEIVETEGWELTVTDSESGGARFEVAGL